MARYNVNVYGQCSSWPETLYCLGGCAIGCCLSLMVGAVLDGNGIAFLFFYALLIWVVPVFITVEVEGEDRDDAVEKAGEFFCLDSYVGNGGNDKLVGTADDNVSITAGDEVIEGNGFEIDVEEIG